jgi:hypothetical protein
MVAQRPYRRPSSRIAPAAAVLLGLISLLSACDKMPLLAPSGTVITIFPTSTTVPLNGEVEIIATVIENGTTATAPTPPTNGGNTTPPPTTTGTSNTGAGTPVQNGTLVSFTTTIGRIEPREARTQNGEVRVKFLSGGQSGTAIITAYSGGASGKLENLKVGTAAVERVLVTASPQTLGPSGGTAEVQARVEDVTGAGLAGVPVNFVADAGQLNPSTATTDQTGVARTTLNTSRQTKVTVNVGGKTADVTVGLNPRTGIGITPPTNQIAAGQSAVFNVNVSTTANIRDVVVNWGDGSSTRLGAISQPTPVQHTYDEPGTYTVTATASDASGFSEPASTSVRVLPAQPPSVTLTATNSTPTIGEAVQITANVSGATSSIVQYEWTFGPGADRPGQITSSNRVTVTWNTPGTKIVTVRVRQAAGPEGDNSIPITVRP